MTIRRGLAILSLSLLLHAMLVLALGGLLRSPSRVIQHIEINLGPTAGAPKSTVESPAPAPAPTPAPTPKPPQPKPVIKPTPTPKPIAKPVKQPEPRPKEPRPVIKEIEPKVAKTVSKAPDTPRTKAKTTAERSSATEGLNNTGSTTKSHTAEESASGTGQKTDASALQAYLAEIRARIAAAKHYPMMAERRRIQGEVMVSFHISYDGRLLDKPKVTGSSGSGLLDSAAVRAVKRAAPFPRFPGPINEMFTEPLSVELDFVIH